MLTNLVKEVDGNKCIDNYACITINIVHSGWYNDLRLLTDRKLYHNSKNILHHDDRLIWKQENNNNNKKIILLGGLFLANIQGLQLHNRTNSKELTTLTKGLCRVMRFAH